MSSIHRCPIDKFRGEELNTISFSPLRNSQLENNSFQTRHLDGSWMLYKYIESNAGNQNLHSYVYNPKKAFLTINARTSEILTGNKLAFNLLGVDESEKSLKLCDFIITPKGQYLFREIDLTADGEVILFSGKVMDLVTKRNKTIPISVWARQLSPEGDKDKRCLVIMEPVERIVGKVCWDSLGVIVACDSNFATLYGYENPEEAEKLNIKDLIPSLELDIKNCEETYDISAMGKTKDNFTFPLSLKIVVSDPEEIQQMGFASPIFDAAVSVFSNVSGLVTILSNGTIHSCNTNFSMMLFGYSQNELVGKDISTLIPSFYEDVEYLDTNSVALPPFDDDDDSNARHSDGRTTADSFVVDLPRPTNPLSKAPKVEESHNSMVAVTPLSKERTFSDDQIEHFQGTSDFDSTSTFSINRKDSINCDKLDRDEISSSSIDNNSRLSSRNEFLERVPSVANNSAESDLNANILETSNSKDCTDVISPNNELRCNEEDNESYQSESDVSADNVSESEQSYDSEDSDELSNELCVEKRIVWSPHQKCGCEYFPARKHAPGCCMDTPAYQLKVSTPKRNSYNNTSRSSQDISCQSIPDGVFAGIGRHKDGTDLAIEYSIRRVVLDSGKHLYCLWVSRDPEEIKEGSVSNKTSNSSHYDTSQTSGSSSEESSSSSSANSMLPDEEYLDGAFSENYTVIQHLGKGAFGCIKKAYRNEDGLLVIAKFIKKSEVYKDSWVFDQALNNKVPLEISLLTTIQHPNIVKVIDVFENAKCFQMVMEKHGSGMDLFEFIERNPKLDEPLASYIFRQMVSAISYLHSLNILHRDIKDENVIINEKFQIKLIDFGSATFMGKGEMFSTFCGTTEYCSPEVLRGEKYRGPELEMFSLGVTLFTLVLGQNPFLGADEILKGVYKIDKDISDSLTGLIKHLLEPNPTKRCTLLEVENHSWVNQPVLIENYKFSDIVISSEDELHPAKYISFTASEDEYEENNNSSDSEVSQLEKEVRGININEPSITSSLSESDSTS